MPNLQLMPFQDDAVKRLLTDFRQLSAMPHAGVIQYIFQAPTGSGKTIMLAEFLQRLATHSYSTKFVFLWISLRQLHVQSQDKLTSYLGNTVYSLINIEDLQADSLPENTILFVNWEKLNKPASRLMQPREDGRYFVNVLQQTRDAGLQIVLIVDEFHHTFGTKTSQEIIKHCQPKLMIQVSATPKQPTLFHPLQPHVISYDIVRQSGLTKECTIINEKMHDKLKSSPLSVKSHELILQEALKKRLELVAAYKSLNININPLLLIQLPNRQSSEALALPDIREEIENYLKQQDITYENGRLVAWLADEAKPSKSMLDNHSLVDVLIFKEAIAVGWDCPRAHILVMLRLMKSPIFQIQTVGRILRMPEAKHYPSLSMLNQAYVYADTNKIKIATDADSAKFLLYKSAVLRVEDTIALPSVYLSRTDYGDLTAKLFRPLLRDCLNEYFNIDSSSILGDASAHLETQLVLDSNQLKDSIITDLTIHNLDEIETEIETLDHKYIQTLPDPLRIEAYFKYILKMWCLPYAPVRSFEKIKAGLYEWFRELGYTEIDFVQKVVVCSKTNQNQLKTVIDLAKERYKQEKNSDLQSQINRQQNLPFKLPDSDSFGDLHEQVTIANYAYDKCYLLKNRSHPERHFEQALAHSAKVEWWYKNGVSKRAYFAIPYQMNADSQLRAFYPDFIVRFKDGRLGIYDTKAGMTVISDDTYHKSNALQAYIKEHRQEHDLTGGIIDCSSSSFSITYDEQYKGKDSYWKPFSEL